MKIEMMKRFFDIIMSILVLLSLSVPMLIIAIWVKITSHGPILHWSERVGKYNRIFKMPKYRTMQVNTPVVEIDQLGEWDLYLTPIGLFLRNSSIDELPQLLSILKGDMSFVGPRPVLASYVSLLQLRTEMGVHSLSPGLTGLAQINGRNLLSASDRVAYDVKYFERRSLLLDIKIILKTIIKVLQKEGITPLKNDSQNL